MPKGIYQHKGHPQTKETRKKIGLAHKGKPSHRKRIMKKEPIYLLAPKLNLPKDFNLVGCHLNGKFIYSGWNKGFWLKDNEESSQVKPVFFKDFEAIKNWEIEVPLGRILEIELKSILVIKEI